MANKTYYVRYKMEGCWSVEHGIQVPAPNKIEAYHMARDMIAEKEGHYPYSSWVSSVTYKNGNYRTFNTCEGLAY